MPNRGEHEGRHPALSGGVSRPVYDPLPLEGRLYGREALSSWQVVQLRQHHVDDDAQRVLAVVGSSGGGFALTEDGRECGW